MKSPASYSGKFSKSIDLNHVIDGQTEISTNLHTIFFLLRDTPGIVRMAPACTTVGSPHFLNEYD